jgi:hypothetical protein
MANTANTTALTTDFNVTPYYDDYDPSNQYYRILFKPGYAVQARELTQMQSALQEQINRFGKNIFKDGSIVLPGNFTFETHNGATVGRGIRYVKVRDTDASSNPVDMDVFDAVLSKASKDANDRIEVVGTSGVKAQLVQVLDGVESSSNTKTLYLSYTAAATSANVTIKTFSSNETLTANVYGTNYTLVVHPTDPAPTGFGSRFTISEGVIFAKNHFIAFPTQSVIIDRYNPNPTARVGMFITEDIINSSMDSSLLDPAQEASNYSAPGADRLKLDPVLTVLPVNSDATTKDFVTLFKMENGIIIDNYEKTQYNLINDAMAKRTYDNSGDYVVRGLDIQIREHDDTGSNFGRYANGDNKLLFVGVSPGLAYVKGYEVGALSTYELTTEKGLTSSNVNQQISSATMGNYVQANNVVGGWELDKGNLVDLYNTAQRRIVNKKWGDGAQSGAKIGSAVFNSIEYVSGSPGIDPIYNIYLSDIKMLGTNTFPQVKNIYFKNSTPNSNISADPIMNSANNTQLALLGKADAPLLYKTGSDYTRAIRSVDNISNIDTTYEFNQTVGATGSSLQVAANGRFITTLSALGSDRYPYGTTNLSAADKRDILVVFNKTVAGANTATIALSGSGTGGAGTTTLQGTGTRFDRLNVGDKIAIAGNDTIFFVTSISGPTALTVDTTLPATIAANNLFKVYYTGDIIDLTTKGVDAGTVRTVAATPTSLTVNLQETFSGPLYATVTTRVQRQSAKEIAKELNTHRYVKIDVDTNASGLGATNPYILGFSDVYKIRTIRLKNGSYPTSNTDGTDVTSSFIFDNGQKDTLYDLATIKPKTPLKAGDKLLVELDYFTQDFTDRAGYFSIDSYPIQDNDALFNASTNIRTENIPVYKSPTTGGEYDLRNHLDFRPVKVSTANPSATTVAGATVNPGSSSTFNYLTSLRFPVPSSPILYDYWYYLGRIDLVVVDRDKRFQVIKGAPNVNPVTPIAPEGTMPLASITVTPYPSLSPAYAESLGKIDAAVTTKKLSNMRYTMRDIGTLQQRIVNLEYYTSLSILEKSAADMVIKDVNGLDRFKNGIFTDTFRDNSLSATYNDDHQITYDTDEKCLRPVYTMDSFPYDYLSNTNLSKTSSVLTMKYTEVMHYEQTRVTTDRNVERQSWLFLGTVSLFPDSDIWVDTTKLPDELLGSSRVNIVTYGTETYPVTRKGINTEWNAWQKWITGYNVYKGTGTNRTLVAANVQNYDQAKQIANNNNPVGGKGVSIETLFTNYRTGTQHWQATGTDIQTTGYKVINTSIVPYIRPQMITVSAVNMKPYTRVWAYFDNVPMANSCRPITATQFTAITDTSTTTVAQPPWAAYGAPLITDDKGKVYFQVNIEANKFRTGQRALVVVDSPVNIDESAVQGATFSDAVTTGGRAIFTAEGLSQQVQRTVMSTQTISYYDVEVSNTYYSSDSSFLAAPPPPPQCSHSCSAYSFLAKAPKGEEGMFLTSVDLFVSRKSRDYGIWIEIREMDSGQQITRNQVPYSEVHFDDPDQIILSPNGITSPLRAVFKAPVFLMHNTQYALVIHPINANPDTYLWVSKLGENDINTGQPIVDRRGFGTFYQTNNNTNWDIIPDVDMAVRFWRADFVENVDGVAYLGNSPVERIFVRNRTIPFDANNSGDLFISGDKLTLTGANTGPNGPIAVGDLLIGASGNSEVRSINGGVYSMGNTGFANGEVVHCFFASNLVYKGVDATVSTITNARGFLNFYVDGAEMSMLHLTGSGGGFIANDVILAMTDTSVQGVIEGADPTQNFRYSALSFEPSMLKFKGTDINFQMKTYSNTGIEGAYFDIEPSETYHFETEQALYSRTKEINSFSGNRTNMVKVGMRTGSNTVSPVLDLTKTHSVYIDTHINSNTTNETLATGGALLNKYISRTVTLAEGQDAEDMEVILAAYRPPGTDVKVWLRLAHAEDTSTSFESKGWVELVRPGIEDGKYSSKDDRNDYIEYNYNIPSTTPDRLTIGSTMFISGVSTINVGDTLVGLTSATETTVDRIEGTIYVMSDTGYLIGETANVVNSTGVVVGNTVIGQIGQQPSLRGPNGEVTYTTDDGLSFTGYKSFSVKIGLLSDNSAIYPKVGDLRCIALQM